MGWELTGWTARQVALAGGVSVALVVLWFLFRPRPPRFEVSSHVLWDEVAPKRRNPLVKELIMLLLQLLMVAALALSLGDPRWSPEDESDGEAEAVTAPLQRLHVVDLSLSMGAMTPDGRTRLHVVTDAIADDLDGLPPQVTAGLVGAGRFAEVLAPLGRDRSRLKLALRTVEPRGLGSDLRLALRQAAAMPGLSPGEAHLELWTDHVEAADILAAWSEETGVPTTLRAPFPPAGSLAVTAFDLGAAKGIPAEEEALVRIANPTPWPATATLALETEDARLGEAPIALAPGEEIERRYRFLPLPATGVEAVVRDVVFDGGPTDATGAALGDALAADDRAYAWIEPVEPVTVTLVSDGNRFLERVLAVLPGIQLRKVTPAEYRSGTRGGAATADVAFFDDFVPLPKRDGPLPKRSVLLSPPASRSPVPVKGEAEEPVVTDWELDHPLFAGLVLRDLEVKRSLVFTPEAEDVRLLGTTTGALVVGRADGDRRLVVWGFDLGASDLPLRLAFPQTIVNTVLWMRDSRPVPPPVGDRHRLADPYWLDGDGGVVVTDLRQRAYALAARDVLAEGRASWPVSVGDGATAYRFPRPGLFSVSSGAVGPGSAVDERAGARQVGVNLFSLDESRLAALPPASTAQIPAPRREEETPSDGRTPWLVLAVGVFVVGLLEFGLYTR